MEEEYVTNKLTEKGMKTLPFIKPTMQLTFYGLLVNSINNLVDIGSCMEDLKEFTMTDEKSIRSRLSELKMLKMISRTGISNVWYIDPLYALNGDINRIYKNAESVENYLRNKK